MNNKENNLKTKVTKEVNVTICTEDFFDKWHFPEKYAIVKINDGCFGIIKKGQEDECKVIFKKISKVGQEYCYLVEYEDNTKSVVKIDSGEIRVSEPFKDIIKIFKKYILVKDLKGERKLVPLIYFRNVEFCVSNCELNGAVEEYVNYALMELPNGRMTILLKEGLITSDIEFDSIDDNCDCEEASVFRIVTFEDENKSAVVMIENLKETQHFKKVDYVSFVYKHCKGIVQAQLDNGKTILIRISDFKQSKGYDKVKPLSLNYAEVTDEDKTYILRLSDFAIAQWPED